MKKPPINPFLHRLTHGKPPTWFEHLVGADKIPKAKVKVSKTKVKPPRRPKK